MFCIPEATLGLGLAGGLSYVLPRLGNGNRALGLCLGLSGMALQGADLLTAQLASQYFTYDHLATLVERVTDVSTPFKLSIFEPWNQNSVRVARPFPLVGR